MQVGTRGRDHTSRPHGLARSRRPRLFLAAFGASVTVLAILFVALLAGLSSIGRLPPPPVTGTACIDAKLDWLRTMPDRLDAGLVAVGSSVTWRNLDFSVLSADEREALGGVVNAAPCYLQANQTRFLVDVLTSIRGSAHTVLTVVAPRDFEHCSSSPAAFTERRLLARYLDGRVPATWLHFRNFRPYDFLRTAYYLPEWREMLRFDPYGAGPLEKPLPDMWQWPVSVEPRCFSELTAMARDLAARDIRLVVVLFPQMQAWIDHHRLDAVVRTFREAAREALVDTDAVLIDAHAGYAAQEEDFADPMHWIWPSAAPFTRWIFDELTRADALTDRRMARASE